MLIIVRQPELLRSNTFAEVEKISGRVEGGRGFAVLFSIVG